MVELETNLENIQKLKNQTNRAGLFEVSINYLYEVIISSSKLFKKDLEKVIII